MPCLPKEEALKLIRDVAALLNAGGAFPVQLDVSYIVASKTSKRKMKRQLKYIAGALVLPGFILFFFAWILAPVGNGYTAKYLCSHVFTSGQDPEEAMELFIEPVNPLFRAVRYRVDYEQKEASAWFPGFLRPATAVYREGCGCTLLVDGARESLMQQAEGLEIERPLLKDTLWPAGKRVDFRNIPSNIDIDKLNERLRREFEETTSDPNEMINTLAIVVAYRDRIIAEQYRPGIDAETPLLSWSASKSITSALAGRLVQTKGLDIHQPAGFPEWENDERKAITIGQLLRMESGLAFDERYAPFADAVEMLYQSPDMGAYALDKPLAAAPGTQWSYSSGTTNILAKILLRETGGNFRSLEEFAHKEFFSKLGMTTAVFEHDEHGAFVGSSYFYASPRDWLRFALLYKNKGLWNGEQLLPEGWVDYSLTPTPHAPDGRYGAQIWLNAGAPGSDERLLPRLPKGLFAFEGFQDQWIVVIPSWDLMVARFGVTNGGNWSVEELILGILEAIDYSGEGADGRMVLPERQELPTLKNARE